MTTTRTDLTPLYAVAGLADVAAAGLRARVVDLQQRTAALPGSVRALPAVTRGRLAAAGSTYETLAGRGRLRVTETLRAARRLSDTAEQRTEAAVHEVVERVDPAFERVQEGVTAARRTVTGRTATETLTPRAAAEAAVAEAEARGAETARAEARKAAAARAAATRAANRARAQQAARAERAEQAAARSARKAARAEQQVEQLQETTSA